MSLAAKPQNPPCTRPQPSGSYWGQNKQEQEKFPPLCSSSSLSVSCFLQHSDSVREGAGDGTQCGGAGDDSLHGVAGDDPLHGGAGEDTHHRVVGDDTLHGAWGCWG